MKRPPKAAVTHEVMLEDWRDHAQQHDDQNFDFLRRLKFRDDRFAPDELAAKLHEQAFGIIDCTRCANCCKTMTVVLTQADIDRIAKHLEMSNAGFIQTYLKPADGLGTASGEVAKPDTMKQQPCEFLGADDRCTIYDVRPECCRDFPHTDKPHFTTRTYGHAGNALVCPAVFWIVEQMRQRARQ